MPNYVKEKVQNIIIDALSIPINEFKEEGNLVKDYLMDDLDLYEIVTALEAEFNISVEDTDQGWTKVSDIVEYIEEATK